MNRPLASALSTQLWLLQLEDRTVPSTTVDLTTLGSSGTINGAIFSQYETQPTGSGVIHSFLRIQGVSAHSTVQQGYNTDARPLQFNENKSPTFTRSLSLGSVPVVDFGGTQYYEFLLDLNQKASQPLLSLDDVQLFVGNRPDLTGYDLISGTLAGQSPVYDMNPAGNTGNWVKLTYALNGGGSGKGDMLMYVPVSFVGAAGSNSYVYLFSRFGEHYGSNAGFQEWSVGNAPLTPSLGTITGHLTNATGTPLVNWYVYIDTNNNGQWDQGETFTITDGTGAYTFDNLVSGQTYTLGVANAVDSNNNLVLTNATQVSGTTDVTVGTGQSVTDDFVFNVSVNPT